MCSNGCSRLVMRAIAFSRNGRHCCALISALRSPNRCDLCPCLGYCEGRCSFCYQLQDLHPTSQTPKPLCASTCCYPRTLALSCSDRHSHTLILAFCALQRCGSRSCFACFVCSRSNCCQLQDLYPTSQTPNLSCASTCRNSCSLALVMCAVSTSSGERRCSNSCSCLVMRAICDAE